MKITAILLLALFYTTISHEYSGEGYPSITKCVGVCEQEAQQICGDEEICAQSVEQVNECIVDNCEQLEEEEEQEKCSEDCIQKHGHEGVQFYNKCIDECVENADESERQALEKDLIGQDPDYQSLLEQWTEIIQDGEIDENYLKSLLEEYEDGLLKDVLPTNLEQLEQQKKLLKQQQEEEQEIQEQHENREDL